MMDNTLYLDSTEKTENFFQSLDRQDIRELAVDIEGEFNLHRYGEHLCLVQIFDGRRFALIDPLKVSQEQIKAFFENESRTKIMYDYSSDRTLLFRQYDISILSVVDLLPAVELLDYQKRGLGNVLFRCLNIEEKQKKKFQQYDWMSRPLNPEALKYALEDVAYLFDLKKFLFSELENAGLMEQYLEKNWELQNKPILMNHTPGLFKKRRFQRMPEKRRKLMTRMFEVRDGYAKNLDFPPDRVVPNELLFRLANREMRVSEIRFSGRVGRETGEEIREAFQKILE